MAVTENGTGWREGSDGCEELPSITSTKENQPQTVRRSYEITE
jgi:hypothetical protein